MARPNLLTIFAACLIVLLSALSAQAQATRTWVSGIGDDANTCDRASPCKTFAGALSKTAVGGEINCLDPGGFGSVTITNSITIDCHDVFASILVSGTNAIDINAPNAVVTLRNLNLDGLRDAGSPGLVGINILAAKTVFIEDVAIMNFQQHGIKDARTGGGTKLIVRNATIRNNGAVGIVLVAGATNGAVVENSHLVGNNYGLAVATGNTVIVSRSVASGNTTAGVEADGGAQIFVNNTEISHNGIGVMPGGTIALANSDIVFNSTGISWTTVSFGNNRIFGNASPGTAPTVGAASTDHGQQ